ncbi:hypothetical protein L1049_018494 [Liquidambar formosana]|uniref:Reverse transcriptase zinc-binding domain-containing protein n=1 Tax=Liquidambar formosana TaxID=63359 RepID=A0AAP0WMB5_LIQFO
MVWKSKVPLKVKVFVWSVALKRINTNDMSQRRRPNRRLLPQWCIVCRLDAESIDHLFLHCQGARFLWQRLFLLAGVCWVSPASSLDMLVIHYGCFGKSKRGVVLWRRAVLVVFWVLWLERNSRIFEDRVVEFGEIWDGEFFLASLWASVTKEFNVVPLFVIMSDWKAICG